MHSSSFITFLAALPATLACLDGAMPSSTGSKSLDEPQYIGEGETFDAKFVTVCHDASHSLRPITDIVI